MAHMSFSLNCLNSLKGVIEGDYTREYQRGY